MTEGYYKNSELPAKVQRELNARGQGAWRLRYNSAVWQGLSEEDAAASAWDTINRAISGACKTCGGRRDFKNTDGDDDTSDR